MPRAKVFTVGLSAADREFLVKLTTSGTHSARMIIQLDPQATFLCFAGGRRVVRHEGAERSG
jgi:hypothetical protein